MLLSFVAVVLLMAPVWILILVDLSGTMILVTVLVFVDAFLTVHSLFTVANRQDVFFGGASS